MKQSKYKKTTEAAIREQAESGVTGEAAANALGVSVSSLRTAAYLLGISFNGNRRSTADEKYCVPQILEDLSSGKTVNDIAKQYGVTRQNLYLYLKDRGLPTSRVKAMLAKIEATE